MLPLLRFTIRFHHFPSLVVIWHVLGFGAVFLQAQQKATEPVHTESGLVTGLVSGNEQELHIYRGIPFAAPPVGDLRWKPPQAMASWTGIRNCDSPAPLAIQSVQPLSGKSSEDCLYLDVYAPSNARGKKLPVMFWIHPGAFLFGNASRWDYTGLAQQDVVVVTTNYRLGLLGFFAHPSLTAESTNKSSGNYGLLDIIQALKWVNTNIERFGGDPESVTVFGNSAGGSAALFLMASPLSEGLFHRASVQSAHMFTGTRHLRKRHYGQESMEELGVRITQLAGVSNDGDPISLLRKMPIDELARRTDKLYEGGMPALKERWDFYCEPNIDGWVMPDDLAEIFVSGRQSPVPLIIGSNSFEADNIADTLSKISVKNYETTMKKWFRSWTPEALKHYPARTGEEAKTAAAHAFDDLRYASIASAVADSMARLRVPTYRYRFSFIPFDFRSTLPGMPHVWEALYVLNDMRHVQLKPGDRAMAARTSAMWVNFAKTGNPNVEGFPIWSQHTSLQDRTYDIGDEFKTEKNLNKERLEFILKFLDTERIKRFGPTE